MDIHLYLQNSNFPVPTIIFTKERQPYIKINNRDKTNLYILYDYLESAEPTFDDVEEVGKLIAKFHSIMNNYPSKLKSQDKYYFINRYVKILESKNHGKADEYKLYGEKLWEKVKNLPKGFCH